MPVGGPVPPIVSVVAIRPVAGPLWAVVVRTDDGKVRQVVVDKRLCTTETVAMAAHVVAMLVKQNQA